MGILDKVSRTAAAAAGKAGNKAGELLEVGKLKAQIVAQKQEISSVKKEIGDYCYSMYDGEELGDLDNDKIRVLCVKIASANAAIADLENRIEAAKDERDAKDSMNSAQE